MNKTFTLKSGIEIPALGFGTWQLTDKKARKATETALKTGYRHIDTADIYNNHKPIGKALKTADINREEVFLTSKVWYTYLDKQSVIDCAHRFQNELQTDYIDLLLIHWPNDEINIRKTLEGFAELKEEGTIKTFGVSNFTTDLLEKIKQTKFDIDINQVEFHLSLNQKKLKNYCDKNDIKLTAYSPLGQGEDLQNNKLKEIVEKYKASPAQIILAWLRQKNIIAIPRSSNPEHIKENFESLKLELDQEDIQKIEKQSSQENRIINPGFAPF